MTSPHTRPLAGASVKKKAPRESKSYWQRMSLSTLRDQVAIKSWFGLLVDADMRVESAEILCDKQTDKEKKLRAIMVEPNGARFCFTRTCGRQVSITREKLSSEAKAVSP